MSELEEKWAALASVLRWESRVEMCRVIDEEDADLSWLGEEQTAAKALMLAVVEEAQEQASRSVHVGIGVNLTALKAEIERLGAAFPKSELHSTSE